MATQKTDSPEPVAIPDAVPAPRSEALEAELAMLESMLPPEAERTPQPNRVDRAEDHGDAE